MMGYLKKISSISLLLFAVLTLTGCDYRLFDSKGVTGIEIRDTIFITVGLMLLVVIPTLILSVWIPFKYRTSNQSKYDPDWEHSTKIEIVLWGIPIAIIVVLAIITYITCHTLDPREPLKSDKEPITIQVVALDWKWLFIYPEEQIATVNEIAVPVDTPVEFLITSNSTMNSFFIPRLGGQLYAMAGMENRLNMMATEEGVYRGISSNYSGYGFSNMKFKAHVVSDSGYQNWLTKVKSDGGSLNDAEFEKLEEKTKYKHPVVYYSNVQPLFFKDLIQKFTGVQNGS